MNYKNSKNIKIISCFLAIGLVKAELSFPINGNKFSQVSAFGANWNLAQMDKKHPTSLVGSPEDGLATTMSYPQFYNSYHSNELGSIATANTPLSLNISSSANAGVSPHNAVIATTNTVGGIPLSDVVSADYVSAGDYIAFPPLLSIAHLTGSFLTLQGRQQILGPQGLALPSDLFKTYTYGYTAQQNMHDALKAGVITQASAHTTRPEFIADISGLPSNLLKSGLSVIRGVNESGPNGTYMIDTAPVAYTTNKKIGEGLRVILAHNATSNTGTAVDLSKMIYGNELAMHAAIHTDHPFTYTDSYATDVGNANTVLSASPFTTNAEVIREVRQASALRTQNYLTTPKYTNLLLKNNNDITDDFAEAFRSANTIGYELLDQVVGVTRNIAPYNNTKGKFTGDQHSYIYHDPASKSYGATMDDTADRSQFLQGFMDESAVWNHTLLENGASLLTTPPMTLLVPGTEITVNNYTDAPITEKIDNKKFYAPNYTDMFNGSCFRQAENELGVSTSTVTDATRAVLNLIDVTNLFGDDFFAVLKQGNGSVSFDTSIARTSAITDKKYHFVNGIFSAPNFENFWTKVWLHDGNTWLQMKDIIGQLDSILGWKCTKMAISDTTPNDSIAKSIAPNKNVKNTLFRYMANTLRYGYSYYQSIYHDSNYSLQVSSWANGAPEFYAQLFGMGTGSLLSNKWKVQPSTTAAPLGYVPFTSIFVLNGNTNTNAITPVEAPVSQDLVTYSGPTKQAMIAQDTALSTFEDEKLDGTVTSGKLKLGMVDWHTLQSLPKTLSGPNANFNLLNFLAG